MACLLYTSVPEQAMAQENREENAHKEEPRKNKPTLKWAAPPPINNADPNVSFAETKMYSVGQSQPKVVIGDRYPGFGTLNTACLLYTSRSMSLYWAAS